MTESVQRFAERLGAEQRARLALEYPTLDTSGTHYTARVTVGPKYTRVDFGGSGKYMVVNATGEIFGIKAYGVIYRGHQYGTLDTLDAWDWSGYQARHRPVVADCCRRYTERHGTSTLGLTMGPEGVGR